MKTILAIALLCFASLAQAQETYTVPASAANVTTLAQVILKRNGDLCVAYQLPRTCTQAQVCTAAGAPGGAACTAAQARAANVRIFAATQAGRDEFNTFQIVLPTFTAIVGEQNAEVRLQFCTAWAAASQANRDSACTTIGASAGCSPVCQ